MASDEPRRARIVVWLSRRWPLLLVVAAAFLLHLPLLAAQVGGYHSYNEGFYALSARAQAQGSLLKTLVSPEDLNNMPLFSWLLTLVVRVLGTARWAIRLSSLAAALACVYLVGVLAERLMGSRATVPAALFAALAPGRLLVGTNAQPDTLMVALALGGLLAYVEAFRRREVRFRALSGALMGLAILAKMNAVLVPAALVCWETARRRDVRWALRPSARVWFALWLSMPAAWALVQVANSPGEFLASQRYIAGTAEVLGSGFFAQLPNELAFQLTPPIALLAVVGVIAALKRPTSGRRLLLWLAGITLAAYFFYHFHSYYLLSAVVFLAMLAALPVALIEPRKASSVLLGLVVTLSIPFTLMTYQQKTSGGAIAAAAAWMDARAPGPKYVVLPKLASDNSGKVFQYYLPDSRISMRWPDERGGSLEGTPTFVVFYFTDPSGLPPGSWLEALGVNDYPVLFGRAVVSETGSIHWFARSRVWWEPIRPWWSFGRYRVEVRDLRVVDLAALSPDQLKDFRAGWFGSEEVGPGP